ncbi:MAG: amidohydrolase family protein, partial [Gemmatimonadota bacterium]
MEARRGRPATSRAVAAPLLGAALMAAGAPGAGAQVPSAGPLEAVTGVRAGGAPAPADLVLLNGRIVTLEEALPEATALAAAGGLIVALGLDDEVRPWIGPATEVIDLGGRLTIPGFIEGHGHFMGLGESRMILPLADVSGWEEIVSMVEEAAASAAPGEWIRGRGWHQEKWATVPGPVVDDVPLHHGLSAVSPENPVILGHASGHASFVNAQALALAGIDRDTPDPPGGTIVRDAEGNPTGLLRETAQRLVTAVMARQRAARTLDEQVAEARQAARIAFDELLAKGVTSFHDAGSPFERIDFFRQLAEEGEMPVRLYVMVRTSNEAMAPRLAAYRMVDHAGGYLTVRAIKRQVDGALGSHGAWLLEPYDDMPETEGLVLEPLEEIRQAARLALEHGYQRNTHAIGDRANREILDLYEEAYAEAGAANP